MTTLSSIAVPLLHSEKPIPKMSMSPALFNPDKIHHQLRPGIKVVTNLANTNPAVAKVPAQVVLTGPAEWAMVEFVPLAEGQTVISVDTPTRRVV